MISVTYKNCQNVLKDCYERLLAFRLLISTTCSGIFQRKYNEIRYEDFAYLQQYLNLQFISKQNSRIEELQASFISTLSFWIIVTVKQITLPLLMFQKDCQHFAFMHS